MFENHSARVVETLHLYFGPLFYSCMFLIPRWLNKHFPRFAKFPKICKNNRYTVTQFQDNITHSISRSLSRSLSLSLSLMISLTPLSLSLPLSTLSHPFDLSLLSMSLHHLYFFVFLSGYNSLLDNRVLSLFLTFLVFILP
jgi:hypothetical protein